MTSARVSSANRTVPIPFRKFATLAASVAMVALTVALFGWMIAQVAEHPGVPRGGRAARWLPANRRCAVRESLHHAAAAEHVV